MFILLVIVIIAIVAIFMIVKFKLEWLRFFTLLLLPSLLFGLYGGLEDIKHFFEVTGMIFIISLWLMSPALIIFSIVVQLFEKKFNPNLFVLILVATIIGGLTTAPYFLDASSLGKEALATALITAPIATFLERLFYRWRQK